jgi:rare lipoprotein A
MKLFMIVVVSLLFLSCSPSPRYSNLQDGRTSQKKGKPDSGKKNKSVNGHHDMKGDASWYGPGFHGKTTANGEKFNKRAMTAAHKTLPFNTVVEVSCAETGKKVKVRINDRGPYAGGRIIDLSEKAAEKLGTKNIGHAAVKLKVVK